MYLHVSAGRYMCGEETGLLNALEGKRANPRAKPPFPPVSGLWGKPTIVNNVETLCNVPHIINNGAAWFQSLSRSKDGGTKLYGASGKVKRPGLWELPMGTTMREILEEHAGGMRDGLRVSWCCCRAAPRRIFWWSNIWTCPWTSPKCRRRAAAGYRHHGRARRSDLSGRDGLEPHHFFAQESCGWCTPCWSGLDWAKQILSAMEKGEGKPGDLDKLAFQTKFWAPGHTFCALAPGAAEPLQSALKYFRDDFERHIREKRCPVEIANRWRTIYIDGKPYEANAKQNLLHACLSLGFDLPYFCWHPALGSVGACRQCAVKAIQG